MDAQTQTQRSPVPRNDAQTQTQRSPVPRNDAQTQTPWPPVVSEPELRALIAQLQEDNLRLLDELRHLQKTVAALRFGSYE